MYMAEVPLFLLEVQNYKSLSLSLDGKKNLQHQKFVEIVKDFVLPGSRYEINISEWDRRHILHIYDIEAFRWLELPSVERHSIFNLAEKEMIKILGSSRLSQHCSL
ncbi:unnamed protein product [Heterosigma akashiwo]